MKNLCSQLVSVVVLFLISEPVTSLSRLPRNKVLHYGFPAFSRSGSEMSNWNRDESSGIATGPSLHSNKQLPNTSRTPAPRRAPDGNLSRRLRDGVFAIFLPTELVEHPASAVIRLLSSERKLGVHFTSSGRPLNTFGGPEHRVAVPMLTSHVSTRGIQESASAS